MAAVMDVDKVKSPTIENGGGLFDPISDDLEDQMSKVCCFIQLHQYSICIQMLFN